MCFLYEFCAILLFVVFVNAPPDLEPSGVWSGALTPGNRTAEILSLRNFVRNLHNKPPFPRTRGPSLSFEPTYPLDPPDFAVTGV